MTRGAPFDLTLTGANLGDAITCGTSFPARVTTPTDDALGKDSTKSRWRLEALENAPFGWHRLRLLTSQGVSNFRPFCLDALPQILVESGAKTKDSALAVTIPCVVVGRATAEISEFYKFTVAAGQRLSFEVLGRRLGSAIDPWIKLYDGKTGRELPHAYCDDAPGLQTDPRLTHTFAAAGEYLIEVRDSTWRGGADFHYRLRIGDFPCAIAPLPLAATRGRKLNVAFAGPTIDGVNPVAVQVPTDPAEDIVEVIPIGPSGLPGWPVSLLVSDIEELLAPDPVPPEGLVLPVPSGVTGRFLRKSQTDLYRFPARKGQKYVIAVQTTELLSPAELFLTLRDPKGAVVAKSEADKPARIEHTAAEDGEYAIAAEHLNYAFGPNEVYRLTVTQPTPSFELTLGADQIAVPQGQGGLIPIQTLARRDFAGPIEVSIVGAKGLSGSLTIAAGAESGPPPPTGQPSGAPFAMLPVRATDDIAPGVYEVQVQAKGKVDGKEIVAMATTGALVSQAMGGLPFPPRTWLRKLAIGVLPKPPVQLAGRFEPAESVRGLTTTLIVTATRDAGFDGSIALSATGLPANVTAAGKTIEAGVSEARLEVKLTERAALGSYAFTIVGQAKMGERPVLATLLPPPLAVVRPFDLKTEPNPVAIIQGEKAQLTVTAARKGGYEGPIKVELRNLPAQVKVITTPATIAAGESATTIELSAAAAAPLGARGDVDALGTIDLGQQQSASPPFAVRVQPPPPVLTVKAEPAFVALKTGAKAKVKVTIERKNAPGPVVLSFSGLPAKVTAPDMTIAADQSTGEMEMAAAADSEPAKVEATITAKVGPTTATTKIAVQLEKPMDR
jgi:hypothetical protein